MKRLLLLAAAAFASVALVLWLATEPGPSAERRRIEDATDVSQEAPKAVALQSSHENDETSLASGWLASERRETIEETELVLESGLPIAGRIMWPDESPAAGVQVSFQAEPEDDSGPRNDPRSTFYSSAVCDDDGRFEMLVFGDARYRLEAKTERREELIDTSPITGEPQTRKERSTWTASAEHVSPGTTDLLLTLGKGFSVLGTVQDDLGSPIESFSVRAELQGRLYWGADRTLGKRFSNDLGRFELAGFSSGTWHVMATARDHGNSSTAVLDFPSELGQPLDFILPRAGRISGVVVDAKGAAVQQTAVLLGESGRFNNGVPVRLLSNKVQRVDPGPWDRRTQTDSEGRFEFDDIEPGRIALLADSDSCAPSVMTWLDVAPGATLDGIQLVLRVGGAITGRIAGADDGRATGRLVELSGGFFATTTADPDGNFGFEGLPPGEYMVWTPATLGEIEAVLGRAERKEGQSGLDARNVAAFKAAVEADFLERRTTVTLAEGESVQVVLELPAMKSERLGSGSSGR